MFNETDKQAKEETPPSRPLPTPKQVISTQNLSTIISNLYIFPLISPRDIFRINKHTMILKIVG